MQNHMNCQHLHLFALAPAYGIAVDGADASDLVAASRAVVTAYPGISDAP